MDDVVALSENLRQRHQVITPANLDSIPHLTRTLSQIHADSARLVPHPNTNEVHSAALRLFSSLGFEADRLRRAVISLDTSSFFDRTLRPHAPFRHPTWLAGRALDDSRLKLNATLCAATHASIQTDLSSANLSLIEMLAARRANRFPSSSPSHSSRTPNAFRTPQTPRTPHTPQTPRPPQAPLTPYTTPLCSRPTSADAIPRPPTYIQTVLGIALHGDAPSAASLFHEAASNIPDAPHFVESLAIIASVTSNVTGSPPPEMVVWGARVVLEDSFATRIPGLENKPRSLPVNDVLPQVMSYVRSVPGGGSLVWKCVFYCLRIGHVKAALHVLRSAHSSRGQYTTYIQLFERFIEGRDVVRLEFMSSYFNEVEHQRLLLNREMAMIPGCLVGEDAHQLLYDEYCDAAWKAKDPYLSGCLVLLMRLELRMGYGGGNHSGSVKHFVSGHHTPNKNEQFSLTLSEDQLSVLFPTVEDYMWFRLWLCRTPCEEKIMSSLPSSTFVSQEEIQTHIRTCGGAHFDPDGSQPLRYAFVLISAGLFEDAVTYLANHPSDHSTHYAVHLAIVLYHLAWIKDEEAFHQLIMKFVSVFCNIYMTEAALYLMTIRKADVLKEHLKKFIISTGEYETLLGRADANLNQNGLLADLLSSASTNLPSNFSVGDLQSLREKAALHGATEAESKGEFTTAAQLYNLARKTEKSTGMTMRNLAAEVDKSSSSKRQLAVAEARNALRVLEESKSEPVVHNLLASLKELVKISEVFEDYWTGRYGSAWAVLREVDLLPLSPELISICQRKISPTMDKYDPCVLTCLKELIKVALHVAEYALEVGSVRRPEANGDALRTAAVQPPVPEYGEIKSLCIFVGMLGLSDGEVNERLVRIELLLT